jgi:hypothetical protein
MMSYVSGLPGKRRVVEVGCDLVSRVVSQPLFILAELTQDSEQRFKILDKTMLPRS